MADISVINDVLFPVLGISATSLLAMLAWLGNRLQSKVDSIPEELEKINMTLHKIEIDLRHELASHDARISVVEAKVQMMHREQ